MIDSRCLSRRSFIKTTTLSAASFTVVPALVFGNNPPSNKLNIALIGCGGRARRNLSGLRDENIVALCDVHDSKAAETYKEYPDAPRFKDFRRMLDEMDKQIDAVVVSTPDHTHAHAAMAAIKRKKHVYCEKPLTHSIYEARQLTLAARQHGVQTQMGNQGHSSGRIRSVCEWIWDGAIGPVREVTAWTNRLFAYRFPLNSLPPRDKMPVPDSLDWDLWLGPRTIRPYHELYLRWRAWMDFGTGPLGDMGCHMLDPAFWALKLGEAETIEVEATTTTQKSETLQHSFPVASIIRYRFPARGILPPVALTWYDGGLRPDHPKHLEPNRRLYEQGVVLTGDKAGILHGTHGAGGASIIPLATMKDYRSQVPDPSIARVAGHHADWLRACKTGQAASGNFDYGGPLTEMVLLGALATRYQHERLIYDVKTMHITNHEQANQSIRSPYREGWVL